LWAGSGLKGNSLVALSLSAEPDSSIENSPMRPVILFDVMDTLVYNPFNREIPDFFGLSATELLAQKHPTAWIRFETGEMDEAEYLRTYFADGRDFDHAAFVRTVRKAYQWIDGAQPLLAKLCSLGFEIHVLSNYPVWYRTIEAQLKLSRYLNWTFVSCLTGVRKPEVAAYRNAAGNLNRSAGDCLFIDDSTTNCLAAESIGMPAIHFRNSSHLSDEMRQRGLLG
jgi:HAD superfamily hydrolase (TIGR01509 family)